MLEIESDLIGDSPAMQTLRDTIARIASSDATSLVRGESGVGKELVAAAIHFNSNRSDGPFVCLNCAALTESLLESELFGHERGSFTGATGKKIGKFEQADGGTLFLDEVGEMPLSIQAKFLRVLEGQPFERVGGNTSIEVDVRVVAATNRDLEAAVEEGTFRKDLFFRLQILELQVPALREHATDIPALASYFLTRCCQRIGQPQLDLSREALNRLANHDWPGNVRELRNVIERAVVLSDGPQILEEDIRLISTSEPKAWLAEDPMLSYQAVSIEDLERNHIAKTLNWTNWNKREASRVLGINRSTLDRKLERYGIRPPQSES
jgi:Nif-specific regulatory protein